MAKKTVQYRQVQTPQQDLTRDPMTQSTITGGGGISTINKNIITPPSISNPETLTPGKQPVVIPDKTTTTPAPVQTTPTTPVQTTPVTPVTTTLQNNEAQINQSMPGILDQNNFLRSGMTREAFEQLPFEQQKAAVDAATQSAQERKALLDQVKYYAEAKKQQGYAQKQEDNRLAREGIQTNIADTQSSQRIADATQNLSNLKQNIAFLGSGGRPFKSTAAIDAAQKQIVRGETTLQLLRNTEAQYEKLGKLGVEFNANAFEEQMRKLDKELKDNVDSTVLAALQGYSAEAALASVDTPKKLFELQQKYLDQIDTSVEGLTNRQVRQMEQLQTTYTDLANKRLKEIEAETKRQEEFTKNQNTLNEAMSKAKGFMVDNNGNAVVDSTGNPIKYREDLPKPIMQDGKMVTFKYDENGRAVPDKVVTIFGPTDKELLDLRKTKLDILTKERELGINQPQVEVTTPEGMQEVAATSQQWRGKQTLQCGELVNDYLRQSMGLGKGSGLGDKNLGNTFQDKVKAIKNIGQSTTPVVGGIFAFDVETSQGNTGHTGIVTAVNADGSIEVLEANRKENSANGGVPTTGTYSADQVQNMVFSNSVQKSPMEQANFENYVMSFVPQQDRGSDKEKARIKSYVQQAMASGMTPLQAGLSYRGFNIQDPAMQEKAMGYLDIINNLPKAPDGAVRIISDLLNKGDIAGADRYVNTKVDDAVVSKFGKDAVPTYALKSQEQLVSQLVNLIDKNPDKIGAFDGRFTKLQKKFADMPEMQQLVTTLSAVQANTRKTFAGSAVTETELKALQDYIAGDITMTPNNLKTMLETILDKTRMEYQMQRADYGLQGSEAPTDDREQKLMDLLNQ